MDLNFEKLKTFVHLTTVAVIASSCLPDPLEVGNLPKLEPKIVVSSQIIPDAGLVIFLSRSIGALDAGNDSDAPSVLSQIAISNAMVILTDGDSQDTLQNLGTGLYGGINPAWRTDAEYVLRVSAPDLGHVEAFARVPKAVGFDELSARIISNGFDSLAQISYQISDPEEKNFYMINVQRVQAASQLERLINPRIFTKLITDEAFNGDVHKDTFNVLFQDFSRGDTIAVSMAHISEPYYDFLKLRNDNRFSFVEFAGEPINYPSNVKGGYGYFNLHTPDFRIFILE
jgi:hypothetical protein